MTFYLVIKSIFRKLRRMKNDGCIIIITSYLEREAMHQWIRTSVKPFIWTAHMDEEKLA
jgi:hypothetical protein